MTRNISTGAGAGARRGWRSGVVLDRARVVHRVRSGDDRAASHPATGSGRLGGVRRLGRSFDAVALRRIRQISHGQRPGTDSGAPFAGPLTAWAGSRRLAPVGLDVSWAHDRYRPAATFAARARRRSSKPRAGGRQHGSGARSPGHPGHLEPAASGSFRTLWGTSWYTRYGNACKLLVISSLRVQSC